MNALTILKTDHKTVETLFKQFEGLSDKAKTQKKKIVERIIHELAIHATIEEQVFYPGVREALPDVEDTILEALEEHHIVKWTLSELEKMTPDDERFDAKVTVLIESVRHHVKEEEQELFPKVRKALDKKKLDAIGANLEAAKKIAPTRPHPRAPDEPPGNIVAGIGAGIVDRVVDAGKSLAKKVMGASPAPKPKRAAPAAKRGKAAPARAQA
jgi:hemerythrin superfamily protein